MPRQAVMSTKDEFKQLVANLNFKTSEESYTCVSADYVESEFMQVLSIQPIKEDTQPVRFDSMAINVIMPESAFLIGSPNPLYYIFSLPHNPVKEPFNVIIESDEANRVVIWNENFGVSGIGDSKEEALEEFENLIFADYHSLQKIPQENLSEGARELLNVYKNHLG